MRALSGCGIRPQKRTNIGIPGSAGLGSLRTISLRIFPGVMHDAEQIIELAGGKIDLLVIIEVVPPLHFPEEVFL